MGLSQSVEDAGQSTPDNFFSRATDQNGLKYWNEKTLSDFLGIPDSSETECPLDAGPVIFRMVSYLGAFPFQKTLAPSVLTFDAMVKVVVLLTERYGRVLRRGRRDRIRLLFGSLADVGRKDLGPSGQDEENGDDNASKEHPSGYDIDQPANDDEEDEDGDDLALAALESLDAIEVFKHDQRVDRTVYEAHISTDTFRRLLMLLFVIAPLKTLDDVRTYTGDLSAERMETVRNEADNILAAFIEDEATGSGSGISYKSFSKMVSNSLPHLFDPLTPLFEHILFSKNLDLSQKRGRTDSTPSVHTEEQSESDTSVLPSPPPVFLPGAFGSVILNPSLISHLSFFLPSTSRGLSFLQSGAQLHPVFSTVSHGSSLTSFSHNVLTWQAPSLMILNGVTEENKTITLGAYLPSPWSSSHHSSSSSKTSDTLPSLFQLSPKHLLLPGNPSPSVHQNATTPTAYLSTATGLALGCKIPPSSRTSIAQPIPHGAGSLLIDSSLESADLHVSTVGHDGAFLPPEIVSASPTSEKTHIDIYNLEIWGVVQPEDSSASTGQRQSAVEVQKAKWEFEAREAERRRNVNLNAGVGDSARESARWLLESAGLVGESGRYGGSV
ncbi:Restriction of telomere capping protein 5 [Aspergillus cristatus]|uniref:Restriction of telomere capping protein 5 n=1 Tax=Aspergillus cristatus TaxID=573508 RepID=A0A1E3BUC8_ASPCR|nr:Restriction of telomere capping protein 5 [Aspergillus cristatus]